MNLIGISGKAGSGKDTVAQWLIIKRGYKSFAFADNLKMMAAKGLNIPIKYFYDRTLKESIIPHLGVSPRVIIQTLGTEWGRNTINNNIWIDLLHKDIEVYNDRDIVITDVRFQNEIDYVEKNNGKVYTVVRNDTSAVGISGHSSELLAPSDYIIRNDYNTLGELYNHLDSVF